jgi:hypothetical protein
VASLLSSSKPCYSPLLQDGPGVSQPHCYCQRRKCRGECPSPRLVVPSGCPAFACPTTIILEWQNAFRANLVVGILSVCFFFDFNHFSADFSLGFDEKLAIAVQHVLDRAEQKGSYSFCSSHVVCHEGSKLWKRQTRRTSVRCLSESFLVWLNVESHQSTRLVATLSESLQIVNHFLAIYNNEMTWASYVILQTDGFYLLWGIWHPDESFGVVFIVSVVVVYRWNRPLSLWP